MRSEFQVHLLNEHGLSKATEIGEAFSALLDKLQSVCDPGREMAIVVTKLQEAAFFAKRSVAVNPANQKVA